MSSPVGVGPLQATLPVATDLAVLALGVGVVGMSIRNMFESIMSEDEEAAGEDVTADGGGLMAEEPADNDGEEADDLGGLGGLEDEDEEDLGGFEDDGGFGEGDGGADPDELEHRLDEIEAEVGSLSSTVETVRNENEQIAESVGEVEENVRKLLDIYEMVTRGVNPFADDVNPGMGGDMGDGGGFGLFDDADGAVPEEGIDQDVAEADAEGFFDEDLVDDEPDETEDFDEEFEEDFDELEDDDAGGTSFEDLKAEYDSEEAFEAEFDDEPADVAAAADAIAEDELLDEDAAETAADEAEETPTDEAESTSTDEGESAPAAGHDDAPAASAESAGGGKPYLESVPAGYAGDLLVVEWLEFLVDEAGVRATAGAIDYYESIDWIDPAVAEDLRAYLSGFDGGGSGALTIDHHARSLRYIGQLNGGGADALALRRLSHGGGSDGIQR